MSPLEQTSTTIVNRYKEKKSVHNRIIISYNRTHSRTHEPRHDAHLAGHSVARGSDKNYKHNSNKNKFTEGAPVDQLLTYRQLKSKCNIGLLF